MSEQLPDSIPNNHAIHEQPSGLLVAETRANHTYDEHPHLTQEPEDENQGPEKVRGISYTETESAGKPFIVAERPGSKSKSAEPEPAPIFPPEPTEPEPEPIEPPTEPLPEPAPQRDPAPQPGEANVMSPEERIKLFNERLNDWNKLLSDSRFVPTTEGYDEMVTVADNIEFRYLDPEVDGVSGMGYFIKGSDVRLNPTQARTLMDKVRLTEWIPAESEEDVMDAVMEEDDPQRVLDMTGDAEEHGELITLMDYSHFVHLDEDPHDLANLEKYKDYLYRRMVLTNHIDKEHPHLADGVEYYPAAYISEALKDFNKETDAKKYHKVALGGLKKAVGRVRKARAKAAAKATKLKERAQEKARSRRGNNEEDSSEGLTEEMPREESPDEEEPAEDHEG